MVLIQTGATFDQDLPIGLGDNHALKSGQTTDH